MDSGFLTLFWHSHSRNQATLSLGQRHARSEDETGEREESEQKLMPLLLIASS